MMNTNAGLRTNTMMHAKLRDCTCALRLERDASRNFMALVRHQLSQPITALRCGLEISTRLPLTECQMRERMLELVDQVDRIVSVLEILAATADEDHRDAASK